MKRTAKWQQTITLKQLRHLKEQQDTLTLRAFKVNRAAQIAMKEQYPDTEPCWTCWEVERRLIVAGVLKNAWWRRD